MKIEKYQGILFMFNMPPLSILRGLSGYNYRMLLQISYNFYHHTS